MAGKKIKIAVIGASGYTGSDLVRLALRHPDMEIVYLTANSHAGKPMSEVFAHLGTYDLPDLIKNEEADWSKVDAVFCGLPHATSQAVIMKLPGHLKIIDMSADFRLRDVSTYAKWYGGEHLAPELQSSAVYGLTEFYREPLRKAALTACPGCYPTAVLIGLLPLADAGLINVQDLVIDAKSGTTGAGRSLKQNMLFSESGEGLSPYAVAAHRHTAEIEQEVSLVAGQDVTVSFTPHLVPMARGELITAYSRLRNGATAQDCNAVFSDRYDAEPFVNLAPDGVNPSTQFVRGSNNVLVRAYDDRVPGRVIVISTLDNLVKGSAGQAIQNFNVMFGLEETSGLKQVALFP